MSLYAEVYTRVMGDTDIKYRKLHNLFLLAGLRNKINCYKQHNAQPDQYYECFYGVEGRMMQQSQEFRNNCAQIDVYLPPYAGRVQDLSG